MTSLLRLDHALQVWVVTHRITRLDDLMLVASFVGRGGAVWLAIGVAVALVRHISWRTWLRLVLAVAIASLAARVIRPIVGRERPFVAAAGYSVIGQRSDDASFPSGHASTAGASAFALSRALPTAAPIWWALAAAVAYSRVYLGVHYPLDVIAGLLFGGTIAWAIWKPWRLSRLT